MWSFRSRTLQRNVADDFVCFLSNVVKTFLALALFTGPYKLLRTPLVALAKILQPFWYSVIVMVVYVMQLCPFQIMKWNHVQLSQVPLEHIPMLVEKCATQTVEVTLSSSASKVAGGIIQPR